MCEDCYIGKRTLRIEHIKELSSIYLALEAVGDSFFNQAVDDKEELAKKLSKHGSVIVGYVGGVLAGVIAYYANDGLQRSHSFLSWWSENNFRIAVLGVHFLIICLLMRNAEECKSVSWKLTFAIIKPLIFIDEKDLAEKERPETTLTIMKER